jgi:erythromycin 3''-O-methyltransferase
VRVVASTRSLTRENLRHAASLLWQGRNPAARVYDSIGPDFFLALDEGWLNLGLWEGDGTDPSEAPRAVRRLVSTVAEPLPRGGVVLDVGNGLGAQDLLIGEVVRPKRLVVLNITESQLRAGRHRLTEANAQPVNGDATRIPLRSETVDGVISVEAAFHFSSRARFFAEAFRVLRPGGILSISDVPVKRLPRRPGELLAGLTQLRVWGLSTAAVATADQIVEAVEGAGFRDVQARLVGDRVIAPALAFVRRRLDIERDDAPMAIRLASRAMLSQVELLWRRGLLDYMLLKAVKSKPAG